MSSQPVTAIFDIGKTNKKFLLFDEDYQIVFQQELVLHTVLDDDGDPCEDLSTLVDWMENLFETILEDNRFEVEALNFSTYGATLVHLDAEGNALTPLYNYLKPYDEKLQQQFYATYGGREQFALETASPPMGMLNAGLQLYWLKHTKPGIFAKIHRSLHFPQYLSYLFTKEYSSECTSIGCHTGLWNFKKNQYHQWLEKENIRKVLPDVASVYGGRQVSYKRAEFKTGQGVHDSSSALAPYLDAIEEPFLLLSTGTWNITLNPFSKEALTFEELQQDCLCYLSVDGNQVKAARVFMGSEYAHQEAKIANHFDRKEDAPIIKLDKNLLQRLIREEDTSKKLQLETAHTSGPYPQPKPGRWPVEKFSSYKEAYHQLMLDLVAIQARCINLVQGSDDINALIVSGGFTQNVFFIKLLASRFPDKKICTTSLSYGAALGAALVLHSSNEGSTILKDRLNLKHHTSLKGVDMEQYQWENDKVIRNA